MNCDVVGLKVIADGNGQVVLVVWLNSLDLCTMIADGNGGWITSLNADGVGATLACFDLKGLIL